MCALRSVSARLILFSLIVAAACGPESEKGNDQKGSAAMKPSKALTEKISIHQAAMAGDLAVVNRLLDSGCRTDTTDEDGRTPLMYAAYNGHTAVIRKLLERGASVNLYDVNGRTALMMASSGPFPEAVRLLLDNQADPDMKDLDEHYTALMYAASEGQLEVTRILLSHNADPGLKDNDGEDALSFAIRNNHKEVADLLKSAGKMLHKDLD